MAFAACADQGCKLTSVSTYSNRTELFDMATLLMPSGSAEFRALAVKLGGSKAGTAMLAPYGEVGDMALSAKVGDGKIGALMVPYGGAADMALSAKVSTKGVTAFMALSAKVSTKGRTDFMALSAKVCGKRGPAILAPYGDAADMDLGAKVGSNGGGGKQAKAETRRVIRRNAAS
jgi:hypothetical protein